MNSKLTILVLSTFLLTSCGGGDGGEYSANPSKNPTEGLFTAKYLQSLDIGYESYTQLTLENGESWISDDTTASGSPLFFAQGSFALDKKVTGITLSSPWPWGDVEKSESYATFRGGDVVLSLNSNNLVRSSLDYTEIPSIRRNNLTQILISYPEFVPAVYRSNFLRTAIQPEKVAQKYDYYKPAKISDAVGSWSFYELNDKFYRPEANLLVDDSGALSGINKNTGCKYSGSLAPRPSGRNVFNVNISLDGCIDAGKYSGVAYIFKSDAPELYIYNAPPVETLKLMAINEGRTKVFNLQMKRSSEVKMDTL